MAHPRSHHKGADEMSYAVIHMQKFKMGGVRGIQNHNDRLKESRTNPDIDYEKSKLNKKLDQQPDDKTYYNRIRDRINELNLPKAVRKDAVVMCGFICTSDKAFFEKLPQDQQEKFFQESYKFLKDRYGEKNIVAATVHYDETTPHMHYYMVPVTPDGRLSAKDIFTPAELKRLQTDYHQHMKNLGFDLERGKPSDRKHLSVQELKQQTVEKAKAELKKEMEEVKASLTRLKSFRMDLDQRQGVIRSIDNIGTPTGLLKNKVQMTKEECDHLKSLAKKSIVLEHELKDYQSLKTEFSKLQKAYNELRYENYKLQNERYILSAQLKKEQSKTQIMESLIRQNGLEPEFKKALQHKGLLKDIDRGMER